MSQHKQSDAPRSTRRRRTGWERQGLRLTPDGEHALAMVEGTTLLASAYQDLGDNRCGRGNAARVREVGRGEIQLTDAGTAALNSPMAREIASLSWSELPNAKPTGRRPRLAHAAGKGRES